MIWYSTLDRQQIIPYQCLSISTSNPCCIIIIIITRERVNIKLVFQFVLFVFGIVPGIFLKPLEKCFLWIFWIFIGLIINSTELSRIIFAKKLLNSQSFYTKFFFIQSFKCSDFFRIFRIRTNVQEMFQILFQN